MFLDGLEDAYDKGRLMGTFAEDCAETNGFSREAQDAFAIASTTRAQQAIKDGSFKDEIVPITVTVGKEQVLISNDKALLKLARKTAKAGWFEIMTPQAWVDQTAAS